eukprot:650766-Rhodomonas_salina.1
MGWLGHAFHPCNTASKITRLWQHNIKTTCHHHDGSIGTVLPLIRDVAGQVLQAHAARPSIARPVTTNLVRSVV